MMCVRGGVAIAILLISTAALGAELKPGSRATAVDLEIYGRQTRLRLDAKGAGGAGIEYADRVPNVPRERLPARVTVKTEEAVGGHIDLQMDLFYPTESGPERKVRYGAIVACGEPMPLSGSPGQPALRATVICPAKAP
ncbi:hypothetical protein [Roseiterribacter gracilis]|uniref:Uncharacterized protein n=1 Tax=Roseiterribacter gracilis TaxID=2812848 RepID=A0A8S8XA08_9PROT|nr:hypothetical protein TMPK1_03920 [Rhodospirillales bacterium TMPK1]